VLPSSLYEGVAKLIDDILVTVESFHLYDRVGRAVTHKERFMVDRLPAIIELCIQAGLDLPDFPTKRRAYPVYMVAGKIVDFEKCSPPKDSNSMDVDEGFESRDFWDSKRQQKPRLRVWQFKLQNDTRH
jgi:hypothetical protein